MRTANVVFAFLLITAAPPLELRGAESDGLQFGVYAADKPSSVFRQFKPVTRHLEDRMTRALGRPVKVRLKIFKTYEEANNALVSGAVDFVRFGPASYVIAKRRNKDIRLLAIEENKGKRRFQGVICVRAKSPIRTLADLKAKRFAFGDENSTIGRYLSQAKLRRANVWAGDLKGFAYLGRHDKVVTSVLHGKFDAGAAKISTFRKYEKKGLRILTTFDNVTKPWVARAGLDDRVFTALRDALLQTNDETVLRAVGKKLSGFGQVTDSEYDFVREGMSLSAEFLDPTNAPGRAGKRSTAPSAADSTRAPRR